MVAVKTRLNLWKRELDAVMRKPAVVIGVLVIGVFMLWLASVQVSKTLTFLAYLRLAESGQARRLVEKYRYVVLAVLILGFVWLDLIVVNKVISGLRIFVPRYLHFSGRGKNVARHSCSGADVATRKNPMRACRKASAICSTTTDK